MNSKSTVEQIRARFDADVERFSQLETGQSATIDAPLTLDLIACASARVCPGARSLLDVGCGGGNFSLKILQHLPGLDITLVDLSRPMLDRAVQRVSALTSGVVRAFQNDMREIELGTENFDLIVAAAVLHHLRSDTEWKQVFEKLYRALRPGGALWISDLVEHSHPAVQELMWQRYGEYLVQLKGPEYRDHVFNYIRFEDTPRSVLFQIDLLREAGFRTVDILHKNSCFAAFGGIKS